MSTASLQLDVESLRTLLTVLDLGGMTRAAERLGMSQSAVSWKIKRLEERVGHPLLVRDGRDLRPTRETRNLLPDARRIVDLHDRAVARLASDGLSGSVRLGSNEEIDPQRMARLLGRFDRTHPNASVEFVIDHSVDLAARLDRGDLDVAILQVDDAGRRDDDLVLWSDELAWVTSAAYPYEQEGGPDCPIPLITFGDLCFYRRVSEPLLEAAGLDFKVAFSGWSTPGLVAAVGAGLGVGILGARYLDHPDLTRWRIGEGLPPLPDVHQVVRVAPMAPAEVADAIIDALEGDLLDPAA